MSTFFSWLKSNANDVDRLSNAGSVLACAGIFAGTLVIFASAEETPETAGGVPATNFVMRMADFQVAEKIAETETSPEETPPAMDVPEIAETPPEEPKPEPPAPQKISDDAIREISTPPPENLPAEPEEIPPEEKIEEPPAEEPPEEKPEQKLPELPPQQAAPESAAPPPAESVPVQNTTPTEFSPAGKRTLYGTLTDAVRRKKFYPKAARRTGRTGTVFVRVEISKNGKISAFSVKHGKAHESLEKGAQETFRRVAESFSASKDFRDELPVVFVVPVIYELN